MSENSAEALAPDAHGKAVAAMESFLGLAADGRSNYSTVSPDPAAASPEDAAGSRPPAIPGYEILALLGRGGMSVVYQARHTQLNRVVALKMILAGGYASPEHRARFRTEAEATAQLQHPNIVQIHEVGEVEGKPYFVLEYLEGGSLDRKLQGAPLPPRQAAHLVEVLAGAVQAAHEQHIIHRDLKPANILLTANGIPRIADFGLAKRLDEAGQTHSGAIMGTPSYMAPEQAGGQSKDVGPAADIYALGAILYECLTGRPPFKAASALDTLLQVTDEEAVPPRRLQPQVARDLETVCLKCLRKDPAERYARAADLAEDLRRFQAGEPVRARPVGVVEVGLKWSRRHPAAAALYGMILLVLVVGGLGGGATWLWRQSEAARQEAESAREQLAEISYLHGVGLAHQKWQDADVARAEQLLESCPLDRRGWEWRYVHRLCHADLATWTKLAAAALGGAISPDWKQMVTCVYRTPTISDVETGQVVRTFSGPRTGITSLAVSSNWQRLAAASMEEVIVWDVRTGKQMHSLPGHRHVALSQDGQRIASIGLDKTIKVWDVSSGELIGNLGTLPGLVSNMAFSPDGRRVAAAANYSVWTGRVKVWDTQTGQEVFSIRHPDSIYTVAFSPDSKRLAGACLDRTVRVWDAQTGRVLQTLWGHTNRVIAVVFSPDGTLLASASDDQTARVWDAATGQELACQRGHKGAVTSVVFSSDGQRLATTSGDGTLKFWRALADPRALVLAGHTQFLSDVRVSPDGQSIASAGLDGTIRLWDLRSTRQLLCIPAHDPYVQSVAFSPDGQRLVSGGDDRLVKVWDTMSGQQILCLSGHTAPVESVAFNPDGTHLASASLDKTVKLWDASTGKELRTLGGHAHELNSVAFSPDGRRLVGGGGPDLSVWDVETGQRLLAFRAHEDKIVSVAFSPNGQRIASASYDKTAKVWDAASGNLVFPFSGHTARVTCVTFSPDGQRLASGGDDQTVRIIVASTGEEALVLKGTLGPVHCLAFSPDGNRLVSGGWDRLVRVWDGSPLPVHEGSAMDGPTRATANRGLDPLPKSVRKK
jgi:WD40 repeat protein/tRNA A-37 threonylcarbamoyl transferase component Bud32